MSVDRWTLSGQDDDVLAILGGPSGYPPGNPPGYPPRNPPGIGVSRGSKKGSKKGSILPVSRGVRSRGFPPGGVHFWGYLITLPVGTDLGTRSQGGPFLALDIFRISVPDLPPQETPRFRSKNGQNYPLFSVKIDPIFNGFWGWIIDAPEATLPSFLGGLPVGS